MSVLLFHAGRSLARMHEAELGLRAVSIRLRLEACIGHFFKEFAREHAIDCVVRWKPMTLDEQQRTGAAPMSFIERLQIVQVSVLPNLYRKVQIDEHASQARMHAEKSQGAIDPSRDRYTRGCTGCEPNVT